MTPRGRACLGALIAVAAALRLAGLGSWSLDGDELYSWYDTQALLGGTGFDAWPEGARAFPLGYLAMAGAAGLLGQSEFSLRLVPALTGIATVAVLAVLRRDVLPAAVAWGAAVLAALSPWLIYHAQTARFYGPLLLLSALAVMLSLPGPGRRPRLGLLAAVAAAGCHPSALLLLPGLGAATLLVAPDLGAGLRRLLPGALWVAGAAALGLLLPGASLTDVFDRALEQSGGAAYDARRYILGLAYNLGPVVGLAAALGLLAAWREGGAPLQALAWAAVLPPALLLLAALLGVSTHQRYALAAVPALLLLAAWGWRWLAARARPAGLALAGAALLLPVPQLRAHYDHGNRHDWRSAAGWIQAHAGPGDIVVADEHATLDLYLAPLPGGREVVTVEAPVDARKRDNFLGNRHEVWVVVKASRMGGAYGAEFDAWLEERFVERARVGREPPPLVRHDNRLVVFQRRERVLGPETPR